MWFDVHSMLASGLALGKLSIAAANSRPAFPRERTIPLIDLPAAPPMDRYETMEAAREALLAIFDGFDQCHMISLASRKDRRGRIDRDLRRLGLSLERLGVQNFDALQFDDADGFPSKGVRGCFNSHLALMRRCAESGRPMLVLEDDVKFRPEALAKWGISAGLMLEQPWDVLYLGYLNRAGSGAPAAIERVSGNTIGGHFYAVQPEFAGVMADFMAAAAQRPAGSVEGGRMYRDGAFNFLRARDRRWLTMAPGQPLATQGSSRSDLTPGRLDTVPGARRAMNLARRFGETMI